MRVLFLLFGDITAFYTLLPQNVYNWQAFFFEKYPSTCMHPQHDRAELARLQIWLCKFDRDCRPTCVWCYLMCPYLWLEARRSQAYLPVTLSLRLLIYNFKFSDLFL